MAAHMKLRGKELLLVGLVACSGGEATTRVIHLRTEPGAVLTGHPGRLEGRLVTSGTDSSRSSVLLVHGLGGNSLEWSGLAESLRTRGITTLAIDLRGHGRSGGSFPADSPEQYGEAVSDVQSGIAWLIDSLGANPSEIAIVGNSLGGGLAILASAAFPVIRFIAWYPGLTYTTPERSLQTMVLPALRGHIIQGSDSTHPRSNPALTSRFLAANPGISISWLPGPGHGTNGWRSRYERETLDTLTQWLLPR
jgi:alpha-beta hydrolase superfamily lysophospholipase